MQAMKSQSELSRGQQGIDLGEAQSIYEFMQPAFKKYANHAAMTCMGVTLTYGEFDRLVNQFSDYLKNHAGIKKGDRIAILLPNTIQFAVTFLAAHKVGAVCVPTNPLYTPREMRHQFADSEATLIVILDMMASKLEEIISETKIKTVVVTSIADQLPFWKAIPVKAILQLKKMIPPFKLNCVSFPEAMSKGKTTYADYEKVQREDLAILQYTGGTTGVAKGAMLTQKNIMSNMEQARNFLVGGNYVEGQEVILAALPLYHIFCLTVNFLTFLRLGCHIILLPKPIPIENTVKILMKYPITGMTVVNTLANALNNCKLFKDNPPQHLKFVVAGGMALQEHVADAFQNIVGTRISQGYGLTEASPVTHANPLGKVSRAGSIGVPFLETECKILDDDGKELPLGEVGELCIKGPQVMKGYWKQPEETAKVLQNGWLRTGDIARIDQEGYCYIVDRKKDMILVSGFNVFPNEVEEVIASHPKVLECAVVGIPDSASGECVKAFVVKKDASLTESELKDFCRDQLTNYKRPRSFEFRESLPKTNVGKILRRELRK